MEVTEKAIRANYERMELHELELLKKNTGLTDIAMKIIDEVIIKKSAEEKEQDRFNLIFQYAVTRTYSGLSDESVKKDLLEHGVSSDIVNSVFSKLEKARNIRSISPAKSRMLWGAFLCAAGTTVTAVTYSAANANGGHFIVMWGLALYGAILFLKGLYQHVSRA